jgi:LPS export ABC transporter protein LptC
MSIESAPSPFSFRTRWRAALFVMVAAFIAAQIVILSPAPLEISEGDQLLPEELLPENEAAQTLATGIPTGRIPEYSVVNFDYISTQGSQKQWKLLAAKAHMYNAEKLVHARNITANLFDAQGQATVITGLEAKYFMDQRDLEIFGDVKAVFPDGFTVRSQYMRYLPGVRKIEVPTAYPVHGEDDPAAKSQTLSFDSAGFLFEMASSEILLPQAVRVAMKKAAPGDHTNRGVADQTTIDSDRCVIHRLKNRANFTMYPTRALEQQFVQINQPTLYAKSRRADLRYGDYSKVLQYMTLHDDVFIQEKNEGEAEGPRKQSASAESSLRYATGGRADFDSRKNVIVLREFPQVYQDKDTVTGEVIVVHRDTDIVEVEHSNAFSEGQQQQ